MIFMGVECYGCQQTKKLHFPSFSEGNLLHLSWNSLLHLGVFKFNFLQCESFGHFFRLELNIAVIPYDIFRSCVHIGDSLTLRCQISGPSPTDVRFDSERAKFSCGGKRVRESFYLFLMRQC